jgi:hypothetical protein
MWGLPRKTLSKHLSLHQANSAPLVRELLTRHPLLESRINEPLPGYGFDAPALIAAVHKENWEIIDVLLDAGATLTSAHAGGQEVLAFWIQRVPS